MITISFPAPDSIRAESSPGLEKIGSGSAISSERQETSSKGKGECCSLYNNVISQQKYCLPLAQFI